MAPSIGLEDLRRYAIARSLGRPRGLRDAIAHLGFVQADPIRAPARAQDLVLRHRVDEYCAEDLDRAYPALDLEEDFFVNYGFLPRAHQALMHPRTVRTAWSAARKTRAEEVLEFVRERGEAHPRDVEARFAHGTVVNAWGGSSSATTHLLEALHYRGLLRVVRRDGGIRIYGARQQTEPPADAAARAARLDALIDVAIRQYAPLPATSLASLLRRLRFGVPHLRAGMDAALARAKRRLAQARIGGVDWYWPQCEQPQSVRDDIDGEVRLLAPFDPIVWDRTRFELFWGWAYRFEAYTPARRRKLGYYALPLLWRERVIGWGNVAVRDGVLTSDIGYVSGRAPRERNYQRALDYELARIRAFLWRDRPDE